MFQVNEVTSDKDLNTLVNSGNATKTLLPPKCDSKPKKKNTNLADQSSLSISKTPVCTADQLHKPVEQQVDNVALLTAEIHKLKNSNKQLQEEINSLQIR